VKVSNKRIEIFRSIAPTLKVDGCGDVLSVFRTTGGWINFPRPKGFAKQRLVALSLALIARQGWLGAGRANHLENGGTVGEVPELDVRIRDGGYDPSSEILGLRDVTYCAHDSLDSLAVAIDGNNEDLCENVPAVR
jgi:hypothetical protein